MSEVGTVVVETSKGSFEGSREGAITIFRGVPYAKPPVAALRFRGPEACEPFDGVRSALQFGAAPLQKSDAMGKRLGLFPSEPLSEDCLTLNVFTPKTDSVARPVLVWIHGGAFISGAGSVPLYSGARLSERGDVVVVTLNYRVGAPGFLCLPEEQGGTNFGLLDQIAALHWVKQEIARFGGDPDCVTVFGESAGAGSIVSLLAMPQAKGLFARAIIQSASPDGMIDQAEGLRRAELLIAKFGFEAGDVEALRGVSEEELASAQAELASEGPYQKGMLFLPVIDGVSLPTSPLQSIAAGSAAGVDIMIGTTRDEMRLFNLVNPTGAINDALLGIIIAAQLPPSVADPTAESARVVAAYQELHRARGEATTAGDLFCAIQTDLSMRHPSIQLASLQSQFNPRTYMYGFNWPSPLEAGSLGSCHAVDVPFVLGNLDAPGMREFAGSGEAATRLCEVTMDAWIAFARSGDPSHPAIGTWPRYESGSRATMQLGEECSVVDAPRDDERALWEAIAPVSNWA